MSTLIQVQNIHKSYGSNVIFDGASVDFFKSDRVGVIGRNGAGKSTLCKLILGEEELDGGAIVKSSQLRLSSLEQHAPFEPDEAVLPFLVRYSGAEDWRCGKFAGRFQIKGEMLEAPIGTLSGGYQTRIKLIAMLIREPNFLMLDEPTNYLDLKTLILLERFLADFPGGYLIVSHDREFLKRTCTKTLDVDRGGVFLFPGDVESYVEYRAEQREFAERFNKNVESQRKHLQRYVDRYRVRASTASRAQSKLKQMSKLETIGIDHPMSTARVKIPRVEPKKGVAFRCEDLAIGYPDNVVASDIRFEIERGEHVAVLGDNGQGKTTFLRTVAGDLEAKAGGFEWGHALTPGYYAQHVYAAIDGDLDVLSYLVQRAAKGLVDQDILDMAGSFLFRGDEIEKPIRVLSGGERARACLAGLLLSRHPVLLLDEPTNHLDFETVEALGEALRGYDGTILFTSHDRTFVKLVATNIVDVGGGRVTLYPGDYDAYVYQVEREIDEEATGRSAQTAGRGAETSRASAGVTRADAKAAPKVTDYHARKEMRSRINRLRKRATETEALLAEQGREKEAIHAWFLQNPTEPSPERQRRADELTTLMAETEERWLALQEELEELEAAVGEG